MTSEELKGTARAALGATATYRAQQYKGWKHIYASPVLSKAMDERRKGTGLSRNQWLELLVLGRVHTRRGRPG